MNLALQKRHEQLERWRQNEAIVEQDTQRQQQQQQQQQPASGRSNRSIQRLSFPGDISTTSTDRITTRSQDNNRSSLSSLSSSKRDTNDGSGNRSNRGTRRTKSSSDQLQVKFSNSTLFLAACANGDLTECERLLNNKLVDIEVTTPDGLTGLHEAAICGNIQLIDYLIVREANINCCDNEGWTPLHAAASLGQDKIVQYLLDHGADATIVNCENLLAYDLARNETVRELIGNYLQDFDIEYLRTQEERAIQKDIERWIKTGQYEERSHPVTNATVLHVLAAKGHVSLMKQILETPSLKKQINLEAKDNEGYTPLLAASFWSQRDIVELLIEHGANIFAQANNGYKISSIHLKNYQQSKIQQQQQQQQQQAPAPRTRSSLQSLNSDVSSQDTTRRSTASSIDTSSIDTNLDDAAGRDDVSSSTQRNGKALSKSRSLEISKHATDDDDAAIAKTITSSVSVDALLSRCELMSERELRKSYKELVVEYERLKRHLRGLDDKEKQRQQEWIRNERQMQRKISELEEENRHLDQWRQEIQRLKDENSSLIRVVSKLSKQH